jgi:multidrug efflux system membrane fusion protein
MTQENPNISKPETVPNPATVVVKRRRWPWLIAACLVLLGGWFVLAHRSKGPARIGRSKEAVALPAIQVSTAVARVGDVQVFVDGLGTVTPVNTVMVKSRVDGQLMAVNYVEGQMLHSGDKLVEIDPRPFQTQLIQAEGQLTRDQALLENARVDLERYQIAFGKNAIPKQQLDTQVATVHQFEGTVKLDEGMVQNAQLQLEYAHINAPISGRVGLRLVDAGNMVHATDTNPLAVITQLQPITVLFSVAEDYLPQIQKQLSQGRTLQVEAFDRAQQTKLATGTLLTLDNQIDTTTGTIRLKALFTNEDNALFPNQFVNARLLITTERDVIVLPTPTIQRNAQGPFVYLVGTNQTVAVHKVSLGASDNQVTAVQGLEPGQIVAADNFNRLQDGARVALRKNEGGPAHRGTNVAAGGATDVKRVRKMEAEK